MVSILTVFTETTENLVVLFASRKAQVPLRTTILAIIGGIIGAIIGVPIPLIGSVVGMFVGVFVTTLGISLVETRDFRKALELAKVVLISRTLATAVKMLLGLIIAIYIIWQL